MLQNYQKQTRLTDEFYSSNQQAVNRFGGDLQAMGLHLERQTLDEAIINLRQTGAATFFVLDENLHYVGLLDVRVNEDNYYSTILSIL